MKTRLSILTLSVFASFFLFAGGPAGCGGATGGNDPTPAGAVCGDTVTEGSETCDDGNVVSNDGCSAACQTETPSSCTPTTEICSDLLDNDCDGAIDTADSDCFTCVPNVTTQSCYSGTAGTSGTGICIAGTQTCNANGIGFGVCSGEVTPGTETCANGTDDDCDGAIDTADSDCFTCVPNVTTQSCYSGPAGTSGTGICIAGTQTCNANGIGFGACSGEVTPGTENCANGTDDDCDGAIDTADSDCFTCVPNVTTQSCYSGPAGTSGTGICVAGTQTCNANGIGFGACSGEVTPGTENCANGTDDDCDGAIDTADSDCIVPIAIKTSSSSDFTCSLISDGSVKCWGNNVGGQLGDGTTTNRATPVNVSGLSNVTAISTGQIHTCALINDGSVKCWGYNGNGQLGDGTTTQTTTPIAVPGLSNVITISAGASYNCALINDGSVKCWGYNFSGQLGDGTTTQRTTPVNISTLSNVTAISTGQTHTCALINDGSVKCWGGNSSGELGDSTTTQSTTPVNVLGLSNVTAISTGQSHTCALINGGSVKCWGNNLNGQLGDSTTTNSQTPVDVSTLSNVNSISAGGAHSCALINDGSVKCWGYNFYGQLGDSTTTNRTTSVNVSGLSNVTAISTGQNHTCVLINDGSVKCWGDNFTGQLGNGSNALINTVPHAVPSLSSSVIFISANGAQGSGFHTCTLINDGYVKCWGYNGVGQLGDGTTTNRTTPVNVSGLSNINAISTGGIHSCALTGGGSVKCWGFNLNGSLGDGTTTNRTTPVDVLTLTSNVISIFASKSGTHTCALINDGSVKCWGSNSFGQLGNGSTAQAVTSPVNVSGLSNVTDISAGAGFTCALINDGSVKCWGYNGNGQLGDGTTTQRTTPVNVSGLSNVTAISAGNGFTCALINDGSVKCWGCNGNGQLGDSTTTQSTTPVNVSGLSNVTAISAGNFHTCALINDGSVKCWGGNSSGGLGDGTTTQRTTPVAVSGLSGGSAITAALAHTCALINDGSVQCWGDNTSGFLGFFNKSYEEPSWRCFGALIGHIMVVSC